MDIAVKELIIFFCPERNSFQIPNWPSMDLMPVPMTLMNPSSRICVCLNVLSKKSDVKLP